MGAAIQWAHQPDRSAAFRKTSRRPSAQSRKDSWEGIASASGRGPRGGPGRFSRISPGRQESASRGGAIRSEKRRRNTHLAAGRTRPGTCKELMINRRREATAASSQSRNANQRIIRSISTPPMTTPWRHRSTGVERSTRPRSTSDNRRTVYWAQWQARAIDSSPRTPNCAFGRQSMRTTYLGYPGSGVRPDEHKNCHTRPTRLVELAG